MITYLPSLVSRVVRLRISETKNLMLRYLPYNARKKTYENNYDSLIKFNIVKMQHQQQSITPPHPPQKKNKTNKTHKQANQKNPATQKNSYLGLTLHWTAPLWFSIEVHFDILIPLYLLVGKFYDIRGYTSTESSFYCMYFDFFYEYDHLLSPNTFLRIEIVRKTFY